MTDKDLADKLDAEKPEIAYRLTFPSWMKAFKRLADAQGWPVSDDKHYRGFHGGGYSPNEALEACCLPSPKCFGNGRHHWSYLGTPTCVNCGKSGPQVAELRRQWKRAYRAL